MTTTRILLTIKDVAEHAGVSTATVRRWIKDGLLAETRIGGSIRIRADELERLIEDSTRRAS